MRSELVLSGLVTIGYALLFILAAVLMQEVRSRLVNTLIQLKSSLSMELSDWAVSGGRIPGHYGAIKREFIWGPQSNELARLPGTLGLLQAARVLFVVRECARYFALASLIWFLWGGLSSAQ